MSEKHEFPRSTSVAFVEYDAETNSLLIQYRRGAAYQYFGVPPDAFKGILDAESVGRYVAKQIARRYRFRRIP